MIHLVKSYGLWLGNMIEFILYGLETFKNLHSHGRYQLFHGFQRRPCGVLLSLFMLGVH
jgi:hypothetical protein